MSKPEVENKEVSWKVLDFSVYGTVTALKDREDRPGVILLAGSGPTDRDWCSPLLPGRNGTARILAEDLAKRGYVTLRYDKLGSGPRVKENLPKLAGKISMQAFLEELSGGVETILSEGNADRSRVYALTNSEGAVHAVNYQLREKGNRFAGFVLTGAPGRPIGDVARSQFLNQSKSIPNGDVLMKHYDEAITDYLAERPIVMDPSLPKSMEPFFRALESPNNLPFSRELWTYNLADHLARIPEPLLVLIGKKDIQVDWRLDGEPLERATAQNPRATFVYPDEANHVLKHEGTPKEKLAPGDVVAHYNAEDAVLDADAAGAIYGWLDRQTGVA